MRCRSKLPKATIGRELDMAVLGFPADRLVSDEAPLANHYLNPNRQQIHPLLFQLTRKTQQILIPVKEHPHVNLAIDE